VASLLHAAALLGLLASPPEAAVRVLRTGGLKMESVALLVSGEQGGSIHVAVLPLLFPGTGAGAGGRARVPIVLEIDGATLLKGNTGDLLRVEVCLYAVARKAVQGSLLETIEADLTRAGPDVERSGLQYTGELSLAPGDYSLRVLVRNALTGEVGLRLLNLTVPDFGAGPLLLPPVFPNPAVSWVAALSRAAQTSPAALADSRLPAAQAVLGSDQEARVEIPVWKLKPESLGIESLKIEILRPDGGRAAELPAKIEAQREAAGVDWLTVSFVPTGLETGRYQIRAAISGAAAAPAWPSPFVLLPGGGEGKVWAELMHGIQSPPQEAREPARSRRRRLDAGPIRGAYREALRLLAAGEEGAARRAVAALETPLLTGQVPASPEDVTENELDVARELAAARPQILLPVTLLHESLYSDAQQRREFLAATHHRELVFALADLYAERAGADGKRTAARLLLGFASRLPESASPRLRERLFKQVLAYAPDEPATTLYLAAEAEREGRYPEAVTHLERLLVAHPKDPEARLRLAVNLRRLGKPADADRLLNELIRAPEAPETSDAWVLALAYQETARALLAAGRLDDAQTFLRDALQRLPGDEKLLLQRASIYDLRSDPSRARQLLADFHAVRDGAESARHRYNRRPSDALNQAWNELVRAAPEGLPALAEALKPKSR
jgi:Flp pilus assembly protein TadD